MGYINTLKRKDVIIIWERNNGKREVVTHDAPYYFYIKSKTGDHTSIYGDKLTRLDFDTAREFNEAKAKYSSMRIEMFESDIQPELKLLSKKYYGMPAPKLHTTYYDIENDYDLNIGYATLENPYAPINAIALYNDWQDRMVVYAVPPKNYSGTKNSKKILEQMDAIAPLPDDCKVEVVICDTEEELLLCFLDEIEDSDVLSGWNSSYFDDPYTAKRLEKMGKRFINRLSFAEGNIPRFKEELDSYGGTRIVVELSGRIQADYLQIFRKYEVTDRPSFKLESIAAEILVDPKTGVEVLPKLEYDGSLAVMYERDFIWFMRYNLRDTEILKGFEERLGYIELANQMCHLSTGLFKHVTGTIKLSELATINYCHHELDNLIVNDIRNPEQSGKAKGALVLLPQVGEHPWIGAIDINSLYPSAIRSINISPEKIIGQFSNDEDAFHMIRDRSFQNLTLRMDAGEIMTKTAEEWREYLITQKWAVSGFGTVFSQESQGIMPAILEYWYSKRKEYQALMREERTAGNEVKAQYYDKLQYVYKIKLNSYYGSLLNDYFRFYDKRLGESTTGTSRAILLHQCSKVVELLDGTYAACDVRKIDETTNTTHIGYSNKWSMLYSDTDSSYFLTHATNEEEACAISDAVGVEVNETFQEFMREAFLCTDGFDDIIKTGREIVAERGIFIDKKRYILYVVDNEGYKCKKLKIMGVDTKKTTLPKEVSLKLNGMIKNYLMGEKWENIAVDLVKYKEDLFNTNNIMLIGLPKGIKNLEKYTRAYADDPKTFLPGHVSASIHYNERLKEYNDNESLQIKSGMKIKVFYLTQQYGRFKAIAIPTDIEKVPQWFIDDFTINRPAHILRLIDKPMNNIIKAIGKETPSKQSLHTDDLLGM